ncbi:MAG: DNA topoisomerase 3 [Defluviitaleaceae bacterium]|nr:DNA topoisomerase 3 [Defluviitaleaceae bacterium]
MRLVICEKPSQAQSYAAVLNAKKRQDGYFESGDWLVSWCYGHLVELASAEAYGEQFKRWAYDTLPILPDVWKYKTSEGKKKQLDILHSLMNRTDVDSIVCATDAGREGELIFRLVYEQCRCTKPVQRLWISSLEDSAVREGFERLRPGTDFDNLYRAALCRAKADFLVGVNATRLFTTLYGLTLNVGRVQSPTLALIVGREIAVNGFVSEVFYTPEINCGNFTAVGEKSKDKTAAEAICAASDGQNAVVVSVEKQRKTTAPPKLFDLTALQREANGLWGFTAQQTLDYAQSLYEKKLCSYPRTDSQFLTSDMESGLPALIEAVASVLPFSVGAGPVVNTAAVIRDAGVTDHHAIIPTTAFASADLSSLPSGERDIIFMIAARLLCAVADKHSYEAASVVLECGDRSSTDRLRFATKGRTVLHDGWKAVDNAFRSTLKDKPEADSGEDADDDTTALPELAEGQVFPSVAASVKQGKTSPPTRYNDATLLSAMETAGAEDFPDDAERKGLGTPATRAATIEKLIKTGFVERQKKSLVPTTKAINLINLLPEDIKSPMLTAEWERRLRLVEKGELTDSEFMDGIVALTRELVATHRVPVEEYAALFAAASGGKATADRGDALSGDAVGGCPRCSSSVIMRPTTKSGNRQPDYVCSGSACNFAMWKNNRFFEAKRKKLDKKTATALLSKGRVFFSDLFSEKTGKTYSADILLDDTGDRVNFKLEFAKGVGSNIC